MYFSAIVYFVSFGIHFLHVQPEPRPVMFTFFNFFYTHTHTPVRFTFSRCAPELIAKPFFFFNIIIVVHLNARTCFTESYLM